MSRAVAAFCRHGIMWGAHVVREDSAREIIAASVWLEPRRDDWLQVVDTEEVRLELNPCADCGMPNAPR